MRSIVRRQGIVVLRSDLKHLCMSESQLSRALKNLIERNLIQRISNGAFVKTKLNSFTGELTPVAPLEVVAKELFKRLKIEIAPTPEVEAYNKGLTTQLPRGGSVVVKGRKITRRITVAGRTIRYK